MGNYDHCKTEGEVRAAYKARTDAIKENLRENLRKIDEETAKVVKECDEGIQRMLPWAYLWAGLAIVWGVVLASGGLFNR